MTEALWTELEKLDVLRERMGIGYEEARKALILAQINDETTFEDDANDFAADKQY
ncbi:MAG: hypothetical protein WA125_02960 [Desulfosporosinus sp.]